MITSTEHDANDTYWKERTDASLRRQYKPQGFIPIIVTSHAEGLSQSEEQRLGAYAGQLSSLPRSEITVVVERVGGYTMFGAAFEVTDESAFFEYVRSFTPAK